MVLVVAAEGTWRRERCAGLIKWSLAFFFEGHRSSALGEICVSKSVLRKLPLTQVRILSWETGMLSQSWKVYPLKC